MTSKKPVTLTLNKDFEKMSYKDDNTTDIKDSNNDIKDLTNDINDKMTTLDTEILYTEKDNHKYCRSFEGMNLKSDILRNVYRMGFQEPSKIQMFIPELTDDKYVDNKKNNTFLVKGDTGQGKTMAYALSISKRITKDINSPMAIILAPTRELVSQIFDTMSEVYHSTGIHVAMFIGSTSKHREEGGERVKSTGCSFKTTLMSSLNSNGVTKEQIIISTPGKFKELLDARYNALIGAGSKKDPTKKKIRTELPFTNVQNKRVYKCIDISTVTTIVYDEADQLFDHNNYEVIKRIRSDVIRLYKGENDEDENDNTYRDEKTGLCDFVSNCWISEYLFSATGHRNSNISKLYPEYVFIEASALTKNIEHLYLAVQASDMDDSRCECIQAIIENYPFNFMYIFCATPFIVDGVMENLINKKIDKIAKIHSGLPNNVREQTMAGVRSGKYRIVVATDVLGRGVDIVSADVVLHYDLPDTIDTYNHRAGRCGRYGRNGTSLVLYTVDEDAYAKNHKPDLLRELINIIPFKPFDVSQLK